MGNYDMLDEISLCVLAPVMYMFVTRGCTCSKMREILGV
jgi:hypothetical protein